MAVISVVVTSVTGLPALDRCLPALEKQQGGFACEVIAVVSAQPAAATHVREKFPRVKLVECSERKGIPELRAIGAGQATGEFVAFTEDRCVADENWLAEILRAHQANHDRASSGMAGYDVVGGAIEPDEIRGTVNWAVYLCEYCFLMLPVPRGEVAGVGGNNVSYRRELLNRIDKSVRENSWEFFLYEELRRGGTKIFSAPSIIVRKKIEFGFFYFLAQRFHFSRSFAGMRRARISAGRRLVHLLSVPLLPPLMLWRIAQQVWRKQRFRREFLWALPALAVFMLSYAAGEFTGYLLGAGDSLRKVE